MSTETISPAVAKTGPAKPGISILLSTVYAAAVGIVATTIITRAGIAAGAATVAPGGIPITGLSPIGYIPLTIVLVLISAVGWFLIARFAKRPARVLKIVVPIIWALTLLPLIAVGNLAGTAAVWTSVITLMIVHLVTVVIVVLVDSRVLKLTR